MERSRMREFFEEGGEPVAQFLQTLSQAFRALVDDYVAAKYPLKQGLGTRG